mmetsp:Transcript_7991/g.15697  ORF Transcript_7991/g.15697 Transcript_7991/m.15697 type:complete len:437 (+) Transcript_7991:6850-8160(+)
MSCSYIASARHSRTESPAFSEQDSSAIISVGELSSLMNIDQTIARSQKIIQESIELSKKNQERKNKLSERVKACMPSTEKLNKPDIIPRASYEDMPTATRRTDFTGRSPSRRTESLERSPIKENLMSRLDDSLISESYLPKGFAHHEELRLQRSQLSDMQLKLVRLEEANRLLKQENMVLSQQERSSSNYKDVVETQQREIERLRDELTSTHSELNRVLQKLHDQKYYIQSVEEELDKYKTDLDSSYVKSTKEYKELYDRYVDLLNQGRSEDRRVHHLEHEVESMKEANENLRHRIGDGKGHKSSHLIGKVDDLEEKLSSLEAKYNSQTFENGELKRRLMRLLDQTGARSEDVQTISSKTETRGSLPPALYDSDSSEERLPPRPMYRVNEASKTPKTRSKKLLKKGKRKRELSADRRRSCKFHCCGRRQCGTCLKK